MSVSEKPPICEKKGNWANEKSRRTGWEQKEQNDLPLTNANEFNLFSVDFQGSQVVPPVGLPMLSTGVEGKLIEQKSKTSTMHQLCSENFPNFQKKTKAMPLFGVHFEHNFESIIKCQSRMFKCISIKKVQANK